MMDGIKIKINTLIQRNTSHSCGGWMPGFCLALWMYVSKMTVEVFESWYSGDCFTKTANLAKTDTGDDGRDLQERTSPDM